MRESCASAYQKNWEMRCPLFPQGVPKVIPTLGRQYVFNRELTQMISQHSVIALQDVSVWPQDLAELNRYQQCRSDCPRSKRQPSVVSILG
jgi:hypothetical protein